LFPGWIFHCTFPTAPNAMSNTTLYTTTTTITTRKPGTFSDSLFSFIRQKKKVYMHILRCNLQYSAQCDGSDRYVFVCTIRRPNRCRSRGDEISSATKYILHTRS
jgi:hypothetical protein